MKAVFVIFVLLLGGCHTSVTRGDEFTKAPSDIDGRLDQASIEDYILALPANRFHEESVEQFAERVRSARSLPENKNADAEHLFIPGDGAYPPRQFTLDRRTRTLGIEDLRIHDFEELSDEPPYDLKLQQLQRVPGGWIALGRKRN